MGKQEFLTQLRKGLQGLPQEDIEERLTFYSEMIDDRMEEGLSEEEAVSATGSVEEIVRQIVGDTPLSKLAKERIKSKRRLKTWEIVLLVLGSPIWIPLGIAAIAVGFSLYVSIWSGIISLWAGVVSLMGCAIGGIVGGIASFCSGDTLTGVAVLAAGLVCTGLSILLCLGCNAVSKGILILTRKFAAWVKGCFMQKEDAS